MVLHFEVDFSGFPVVAGLGQEGADQAEEGLFIGEDAGRAGAAFEFLVATLDEKALAVLHCMADEVRLQELATRHGVCRSSVQSWRNQLTELVRSFMGEDLLRLVQRTPRWRESLFALREQMACRLDRRTA